MRKERKTLKTAALLPNTGQLDWLPKNPRQWTKEDVARTVMSIEEDTDFLEDRPLLVTPKGGSKWVVFAGNLRLTAAKELGLEEMPCVIYYPESKPDDGDYYDQLTIKRRAMKDNGSFGSWDFDELANAWDDLPLEDWGIGIPEAPRAEDFGENFTLPDGEKEPFQQMAFTLADEQAELVKEALGKVKKEEEYKQHYYYGNENSNGNALTLIVEEWLASRT